MYESSMGWSDFQSLPRLTDLMTEEQTFLEKMDILRTTHTQSICSCYSVTLFCCFSFINSNVNFFELSSLNTFSKVSIPQHFIIYIYSLRAYCHLILSCSFLVFCVFCIFFLSYLECKLLILIMISSQEACWHRVDTKLAFIKWIHTLLKRAITHKVGSTFSQGRRLLVFLFLLYNF